MTAKFEPLAAAVDGRSNQVIDVAVALHPGEPCSYTMSLQLQPGAFRER
jgi:hypothetical protein